MLGEQIHQTQRTESSNTKLSSMKEMEIKQLVANNIAQKERKESTFGSCQVEPTSALFFSIGEGRQGKGEVSLREYLRWKARSRNQQSQQIRSKQTQKEKKQKSQPSGLAEPEPPLMRFQHTLSRAVPSGRHVINTAAAERLNVSSSLREKIYSLEKTGDGSLKSRPATACSLQQLGGSLVLSVGTEQREHQCDISSFCEGRPPSVSPKQSVARRRKADMSLMSDFGSKRKALACVATTWAPSALLQTSDI